MTPEQLAQLREMAENATPGNWNTGYLDGSGWLSIITVNNSAIAKTNWGCSCCEDSPREYQIRDAAFIAAANPAVILELLDQLSEANRVIEVLRHKDELHGRMLLAAQSQLAEALANEQSSATAYAEVKAELANVKMECSGMGKVLSSGVVVKTEEYLALVAAQKELAIARERVNELESVAIEVSKLESDAGSDCPMCLKNHPGHSRQRCDDHCLVVAAKNALAGAEPKSRGE